MSSYRTRFRDQTERLSRLAHRLTPAQWDAPSLCAGWRVRDVFGHMTMGASYGLGRVARETLRRGGNVTLASRDESIAVGSAAPADLVAAYDRARGHPIGMARLLPAKILFGDNVIHELDVRLALGIDDPLPDDVAADALDLCTTVSTPLLPVARRCRGLNLEATDLDWKRPVAGAPTVRAGAEWLVVAIAGRRAGLEHAEGDGVGVLARRYGAAVPAARS